MADIYISQQDYRDAQQITDGAPKQLNGWEANTATEELTAVATTIDNSEATIPADFKDHKTVFLVIAGSGGATVTFEAGTTYGARKVDVEFAEGTSLIALDSTKFADKITGEITVSTEDEIDIVGVELR